MMDLLKNRVTVKKYTKVANGRGGFTLTETDLGRKVGCCAAYERTRNGAIYAVR